MIVLLIYALLFLLVAIVSGNNLSACSGAVISGRIVGRKTGIFITILGYVSGFALQGGLLRAGLAAIMPSQSAYLVVIALAIALLVFIVAHRLRVPQSLTVTFAMILVGIEIAYGKMPNSGFVVYMVAFWMLSAAFAGVLTLALMRFARKRIENSRIWVTVGRLKLLLIVVSFLTAFVLGANTIGFVFASVAGLTNQLYATIITIAAIAVGSLLLSRGELNRIGNEIISLRYLNAFVLQSISVMLVELATILSIPASNTQIFTASLYGAGISYRTRMIRRKPMLTIIFSWVATAIIGLVMGYAATTVVYHLLLV
ncbi:MAG: inorganic phosphate transporter [Candidatus Micrarchaeaceae archaeon]